MCVCVRRKKIKIERKKKSSCGCFPPAVLLIFHFACISHFASAKHCIYCFCLSLSLLRTVYNRHASVVIADFPPRLLLFPLAIFPSPSQATSAALHATRGPRMHSCQSYLHNRPDWTVSCRDRGLCKSWLGSQPATHPPAV